MVPRVVEERRAAAACPADLQAQPGAVGLRLGEEAAKARQGSVEPAGCRLETNSSTGAEPGSDRGRRHRLVEACRGRTYTSARNNPGTVRITSGTYDVGVTSVEIEGKPSHELGRVEVEAHGRVELSHEFESGLLRVGAVSGGELIDVTVGVVDAETGRPVCQGRTYTDPKSNPRTFEVSPGRYRVSVKAVRLEGRPKQQFEVTIEAGQTVEQKADFGS